MKLSHRSMVHYQHNVNGNLLHFAVCCLLWRAQLVTQLYLFRVIIHSNAPMNSNCPSGREWHFFIMRLILVSALVMTMCYSVASKVRPPSCLNLSTLYSQDADCYWCVAVEPHSLAFLQNFLVCTLRRLWDMLAQLWHMQPSGITSQPGPWVTRESLLPLHIVSSC